MKNYIIRALAENKKVRIFTAITTEMVEKARKIHNTTPVSTAALGRTITAASIMGYMLKGDKDKLTLKINGSNEIKSIVAVSDTNGNVKAYISNPNATIAFNSQGKLDVGGAVGKNGKISIIKDLNLKKPYIGQANLISGEIAEDIAAYYMYSEQQPSVVSLGVLVDEYGKVIASGGFIIQPLPDVEEEILIKLENAIKDIPSISTMINEGMTGEEITNTILKDLDVEILEKKEVDFICDCNQEKIERVLISMGEDELTAIIEEDGKAEIVCHFCNHKYHFSKEQLQNLLKKAKE